MSRMIKFIASTAVMAVLLVGPRAATADGTIAYDTITANTGPFFRIGFNMVEDVHLDAVKNITGFDIRFSSGPGGSLHVRVWENDPSNSSFPFLDGRLGSPALLAEATVTGLGGNSIAHIDLPAPIEAADIWVGLESAELAFVGLDIGSTFTGGSSIDQLLNIFFSGTVQTWGSVGSGNQVSLCCPSFLGSIAMRVYGDEIAPAVTPVDVDIKPGSFPNAINLCAGGGVTPLALIGSETFDPNEFVVTEVRVGDNPISAVGKGKKEVCVIDDVTGDFPDGGVQTEIEPGGPDTIDDLVCHVPTVDLRDSGEITDVDDTDMMVCVALCPIADFVDGSCAVTPEEICATDSVKISRFCEG